MRAPTHPGELKTRARGHQKPPARVLRRGLCTYLWHGNNVGTENGGGWCTTYWCVEGDWFTHSLVTGLSGPSTHQPTHMHIEIHTHNLTSEDARRPAKRPGLPVIVGYVVAGRARASRNFEYAALQHVGCKKNSQTRRIKSKQDTTHTRKMTGERSQQEGSASGSRVHMAV